MKKTNRLSILTFVTVALMLMVTLPSTKALAQAYQGHLRFLENFAIRLYDQGDTDQAMKEFRRLQGIDPTNAVAANYLKKISSGEKPASRFKSSADRLNSIAADVEALKKDILNYERDTQELETIIRDLITENDSLYVMLEKRTRELMELRSKLFGTSYTDNYLELQKTLPIARVPQRLHRPADYLPETSSSSQATALNYPIVVNGAAPGSEQLMEEKRDLLLNKALTVAQTTDKLSQVKSELADMNARLKRASGESASMLDDIDRYYRNIKEEIAYRNYDSQRAFSDLIIDYAAKLRELDSVKSSVRLRDNALTNMKPEISANTDEVSRLNQAIADKDREIVRLNGQVVALRNENAAQKTTIDRQSADIRSTSGQLDSLNSAVGKLETLLRANDQKIAELESRSARTGLLMPPGAMPAVTPNVPLSNLKEETAKKTALTLELQQKNADLNARLAAREKELNEALRSIQALKAEAQSVKSTATGRGQELEELKARLNELEQATGRKATALTEQKENLARFTGQLNTFENQIADLNAIIAKKETELGTAKRALAAKEEALGKQDTFILQLEEKSQLLDSERASLQEENDRLKAELTLREAHPSVMPTDNEGMARLKQSIAERDERIKAIAGENRRLMAMIKLYEEQTRTGVRTPIRPAAYTVVNEAARQTQLKSTLDQEENEALIKNLQAELDARDKSLTEAQARVAQIELKSSAGEIKQNAMKSVIGKRDDQMTSLQADLDEAKAGLAKATAEITQLRAVQSKLFIAESQLKDNKREADDLRMEISQVREQLRAAHEASAKKDVALSQLEQKKAQLEGDLNQNPKYLNAYRNKMKTYTWKTTQDIRSLKNEVKQTKERLAERNAEVSRLQEKLKTLAIANPANAVQPESGTSGCLLQCEEQTKTTGTVQSTGSGCLLNCQSQK